MKEIDHLARLAALELDDAERAALARDLERIIAWAESIREVSADGSGESPRTAMQPRTDDPRPSLPREEVAARAPRFENGMFVVPLVIEDA